jgi:ribosomal-protein-alanine N-acetyltransferase
MASSISLTSVDADIARELAGMLNHDVMLRNELGFPETEQMQSPDEFLRTTLEWQQRTRSRSYAILLNDKAIGLISLSHMDGTTARIGYWLSSSYWNKGCMTQAFSMLLEQAVKSGFKTVKATIDPKNIASIKIWEKWGASIHAYGKRLEVVLSL